jgi:hypothetical protein
MRALAAVVMLVTAGCSAPQPEASGPTMASDTRTQAAPTSAAAPVAPPANATASPPPQPPQPQKVGAGHIVVGGPHSRLFRTLAVLGAPGIDGFFFEAPPAGTNVTTVTKDTHGLGYDLDFNFHDQGGTWLGGCQTPAKDEVCTVPEGAARGEVAAYAGADLDVEVYTAPGHAGTPVGDPAPEAGGGEQRGRPTLEAA